MTEGSFSIGADGTASISLSMQGVPVGEPEQLCGPGCTLTTYRMTGDTADFLGTTTVQVVVHPDGCPNGIQTASTDHEWCT